LTPVSLLLSSPAVQAADQHYFNKVGYLVQGIQPKDNLSLGWLVGMQVARFIQDSPSYFGFELDYGGTSSPKNDHLWLLGVNFGAEKVFSSVLVGGSLGVAYSLLNSSDQIGSVTIKPDAYLGLVIGGGWRILATGGYINTPNVTPFSGFTFGIRIDYKTEVTIKGVDN
jgi:hypothetical protein